MKPPFWFIVRLMFAVLVIALASAPAARAAPLGQRAFPDERASALLAQLTPEERVGQLFLITFQGTDTGPDAVIRDLIANHHIGGVILRADKDNFIGPDNTLESTLNLNRALQQIAWSTSQNEQVNPATGETYRPAFIPLLIGINQEGNGYPYDQILNGLTPLPTSLALGATWRPELAKQVGEILGRELSALGFNVLLGPSLDVLENPSPESSGDLGIRTFGGDPYWVGKVGQAFITGVHQGSANRIALVGKHFPGHGGSDRRPEEEVSTVRKSLEQLKQIELAPFFAVTGEAPSPDATIDALLTSHIRYQGLQGNIRATTNPVSFDPQAFGLLMDLPPFVTWREAGGVVMSDDLGSQAVRRFYDPEGQSFNGRTVALNAFLAGNDLLYTGDFTSSNDPDNLTTVLRTLEFFAQKYREDPAFAQRVDQSVLRILSLKLKIFDAFTLVDVLPTGGNLDTIGQSDEITFEVARTAATLISPPPTELDNEIPESPAINDRIVFLTDSYTARQCSECPEQPVVAVDALQQVVENLYGPDAGGQILPYNMVSFSSTALMNWLDTRSPDAIIGRTLRSADWIVFVMLDVNEDRPASMVLRRFLSEQPNLVRNKKLVVFALDAPYYLDATDISKLSAYFGLYSKAPQFIDVAARLLFKELRPKPGAMPVSVPGVGYDLISATSPDPSQTIPLFLDLALPESATPTVTPIAPETVLHVGDLVAVRTGVILDHNGNPVPDNTPVQFILTVGGQEGAPQVATTTDGVAQTTFIINSPGTLTIHAQSGDPPALSAPIQLDIPPENGATPAITPSPSPTNSPTPEPSPTALPPTATSTPLAPPPPRADTDLGDWVLALAGTALVGAAAYITGTNGGQVRWGIRWGLCAAIGGLMMYTYLSLNLPGAGWLLQNGGRWAIATVAAIGAGMGWLVGVMWREVFRPARRSGM